MFRRILLPTDGSECALHAAAVAADIARRYNARLTVLAVVEPTPAVGMFPAIEERRALGDDQLTAQAEENLRRTMSLVGAASLHSETELVHGSAVPAILSRSHPGVYDLVVIGARGMGTRALDHVLIGSVAEGVIHGAECSVLMVRPSEPQHE